MKTIIQTIIILTLLTALIEVESKVNTDTTHNKPNPKLNVPLHDKDTTRIITCSL